MASSINGANIGVVGSPDIYYNVTYKASRPSNSTAKYDFTIKTKIGDHETSWLGTGYVLTLYITVGGVQQSVVLKTYGESWTTQGVVMSTKTVSVTCPSTTANTNQTVTFQVVNKSSAFDGSAGEIKTTNYYVTSPALLYTACTAPTTFTASSNNFESNVVLSWSGAKAGTNNSIKYYYIQYAVSSNNSTWGNWTGLKSVALTSTSGSYTANMSSVVSRGYYVKFRIRTEGSAGSSYYSGYKTSGSIRRNPYTQCTAPTSFTMTSDMSSTSQFDIKVTLAWSGATSGSNNAINSYLIRYRTSADKSTWSAWKDLKTIATTKTSGSIMLDLSSLVTRTHYIEFAIKTQGNAGSSYYSPWKFYQTSLQRNPYTKCTAPTSVTITSEADINGAKYNNIFNSSITIAWSAGGAGENNAIKRYCIEYCTSSNDSTWGSWDILQSSDLTPVGTSSTTVDVSSKINRGAYMKIRIRTEGVKMDRGANGEYIYYSNFIESASIKRNSVPNAPTTFTISSHPTLEFSKGEAIKLQWDKPIDIDDNIFRYRIQYAIGSKNNISNNIINNSWSNLATIDNKNTLEWTISAINSLFEQTENYQSDDSKSLIQFRIQVVDVFQEYNNGNNSYYTYSPIVTRYDMTGIAIGIDGKWVNCQLFVGTPIDILNDSSMWYNLYDIPIDGFGDTTTIATKEVVEAKGLFIQRDTSVYDNSFIVGCRFEYYDENNILIHTSNPTQLGIEKVFTDEQYKYVVIYVFSVNSTIQPEDLRKTVIIKDTKNYEWVEQEVSAGINSAWVDADNGI